MHENMDANTGLKLFMLKFTEGVQVSFCLSLSLVLFLSVHKVIIYLYAL